MAPGAGLMLGMGRTTNAAGDTLSEYEQTRIEQRGDRLVFTASPSGQATDSFTSIELTDSLVVFENKQHDFPQRVGYRLLVLLMGAVVFVGESSRDVRRSDRRYENVLVGPAVYRRFEIGDVRLDRLVAFIADRPCASIDVAPASASTAERFGDALGPSVVVWKGGILPARRARPHLLARSGRLALKAA